MKTLEEAIGTFEQLAKLCKTNGILETQEFYKQLAEWLRELKERRNEPYLTIEQIAAAVGTQTIHSAYLWLKFARTLDALGYAVVERRTDDKTDKGSSC